MKTGTKETEGESAAGMFGWYMVPEIVREILMEGTDSLKLDETLTDIAVSFVDIRVIYSYSGETLDLETVADALQGRIRARSLGSSVKLKGRTEGFEVWCRRKFYNY